MRFHHFPGVRSTQLPEDMGSGAAWGDFDDDGDDDLYIVNVSAPITETSPQASNAGATSRLFRNDRGAFVDVTAQAGVGVWGCGIGAAWADADGDGGLDLVVSTFGGLRLFRNRGNGTFDDVTTRSGLDGFRGFWTGLSWADYDRDGDLDLYVCGYVHVQGRPAGRQQEVVAVRRRGPLRPQPVVLSPPAEPAAPQRRARPFTDVATAAGVVNDTGRSLSAAWADFDDDGWIDLYVANDVSDNALYRNLGQRPVRGRVDPTWVADPRGAMGLAVGDWDLDGDFDIFVTHWLAQENALFSNMRIGTKGAAPGKMVFMDVADQEGLGAGLLDS